jgi:hypothetical protein
MNDAAYHKEILSGLEGELEHQTKLLASLKGWVTKCHVDSKSLVNPLQTLIAEGETRKANVSKAIAAVKEQMKSSAAKVV